MKKFDRLTGTAVALLLLVLLPTLLYTAYELSSMSTGEQILGDMYNRQLDAILYSVNQYAWDVVNSWANIALSPGAGGKLVASTPPDSALRLFGQQDTAIKAFFFSDSSGRVERLLARTGGKGDARVDSATLTRLLQQNKDLLQRLVRYSRSGYRKLDPVYLGDSARGRVDVCIVFASGNEAGEAISGFIIDADEFCRTVLARKLNDVAGTDFILAVLSGSLAAPVYSTSPVKIGALKQQKPLWLFPSHTLGIRLQGVTVEELVRARAYRNFVLLGILDLVLLAGAWFVYRTIRREMELVRIKSDLVSNLSHELRTPLALIRMFAETLEMDRVRTEEKKHEYYSTIVKESERLTRLINNILDFSKMEAGKKQYHFQGVDVNTAIADVMNTYSYHLQSEGITPEIILSKNLPPVSADPEALTEALLNLIDNAIKYRGEGKFLSVRSFQKEGVVGVEVEDHGIGISSEDQKKIFDTFYRVSSGLVHNTKGSGLGLSLVKHIMDAHGAEVEVESSPGKGSIFRLLFIAKNTGKADQLS